MIVVLFFSRFGFVICEIICFGKKFISCNASKENRFFSAISWLCVAELRTRKSFAFWTLKMKSTPNFCFWFSIYLYWFTKESSSIWASTQSSSLSSLIVHLMRLSSYSIFPPGRHQNPSCDESCFTSNICLLWMMSHLHDILCIIYLCNILIKISCGTFTLPRAFIFFFHSFCLARSLRLRVMSPP